MTRRAPRPSARRPACPRQPLRLSSFPPSYPTSFLASPHSSSSLLSPSAAAAAFASVAGMQFPSYFGIYFGPLPRGPIFRSLAPSVSTSFFPPSDRESSGLPVRLRAGARQWQRYHVTSTPPPPHLKKANCIERHRCHRRPPPIARLFRRSFFRFASFSLATLDECTFHWRHGGRGRAGGRPDAAAEVESVARAAAEAASELPYFHQAKLPTAGRTER